MGGLLSGWIISIAAIVCLAVIVELILPSGQMAKYIKGIFSFIIMLVVISPLPRLGKMDIDLDSAFSAPDIGVQKDYIASINESKLMAIKEDLEREIEDEGYVNVTVSLNADIFDSQLQIKSIYVDLSLLVISGTAANTDIVSIKQDIAGIIQKKTNLEKERIEFG